MIIGVTGTFASGKDTVAEYLAQNKGYAAYSLADEIRHEANARGVSQERSNLKRIGNELRETEGPEVLAKRVAKKIQNQDNDHVVVTAFRNVAEIEVLMNAGDFVLVAIDAPVEIRYERMSERARIGDNGLTLEEFKAQEASEQSGAAHEQQNKQVFDMATHVIMNDGSLEELHSKVDEFLTTLNV